MEIERRERDPDTGEIVGAGFGDVFGKIVAKLTGKTAKNLQQKQQKKLVEKGAEKVGEKTGQLLVKKFMINFQQSVQLTAPAPAEPMRAEFPSEAPQTKGKEIGKMLAASPLPSVAAASNQPLPDKNKFLKINNVYADLL